jgi:hypothetical protein
MRTEAWAPHAFALCAALSGVACGAEKSGTDDDIVSAGPDAGGGSATGSQDAGAAEGGAAEDGGPSAQLDAMVSAPQGDAATCAVASTEVGLLPVHLAFAFDVSGSMGKGDKAWHDKALKWDPVVRATRSFFEDPSAKGLQASLTFFPADGDEDERCDAPAYAVPDVPMTALPSPAFYSAIQAIEPKSADDWRGGTPTLFVVQGTRTFLKGLAEKQRGKFVIVLVTDGYPQGCDEEADSVDAVVAEARAAAAEGVRTYVIGVANPPLSGAPDTVTDLQKIAVAGQTEKSYLIATGNESATAEAFKGAVSAIKEAAASCEVSIPAPEAGRSFDKRKVAVRLKLDGSADRALHYDAECKTKDAWHYDDVANPQRIALCGETCDAVQEEPKLRVEVQFACESLILL